MGLSLISWSEFWTDASPGRRNTQKSVSFIICCHKTTQTASWGGGSDQGNISLQKDPPEFTSEAPEFPTDEGMRCRADICPLMCPPSLSPDAAEQRCSATQKCALICVPLPEAAEAEGGMRDGTVTNTPGPWEFLRGETRARGP